MISQFNKCLTLFTIVVALTIVHSDDKPDTAFIAEKEECSPKYCENKRFKCVAYNCTDTQVLTTDPVQCICCPICFKKIHEGQTCGFDKDSTCDIGLACTKGKCQKY